MNFAGNKDVLSALLDYGADPDRKNNHGVSALDTARNLGNQELIDILSSPRK
jgi:ankyrin repeat protein